METYIDKVTDIVRRKAHIKSLHLAKLYALLVLTKGTEITLEDVHDAWAMDMNFRPQTEHCYGHEHQSIIPFSQLSEESQQKDQKFVIALRKIAVEAREIKQD